MANRRSKYLCLAVVAVLCLGVITTTCFVTPWYHRESQRVAIRRNALERLEAKGGLYVLDYRRDKDIIEPVSGPWINRKLFGLLSTQSVETIQFRFGSNDPSRYSEAEIREILSPFREELVDVSLSGTNASDDILLFLRDFRSLEGLGLCNTLTSFYAVQQFSAEMPNVFIVHPAMNSKYASYCGSERIE